MGNLNCIEHVTDPNDQPGCEYCREWDSKDLINTMTKMSYKRDNYPGICVRVDGNELEVASLADTYEPSWQDVTIKINFCPICGRDLREEEDLL